MKKLEKLMLAAINEYPESIHHATDWATREVTGRWTNDKLLRRIGAVIDLADAGEIVGHDYDSTYHSKAYQCWECRHVIEESTPPSEYATISTNELEG